MKKITFLTVLIAFLTLWSANTFAKEYDLWFCATQVTDANKDNIKGGVYSSVSQTGTAPYNTDTKTLTLNNVTVPETGHSIIRNEINGLTINLIGENICNSSASYHLNFFENTTIKGSGSLCIVGRGYNIYSGIRLNDGAVLTIENTKITLGWPISSHIEDRSGKLVVKNSSVICSQIKYLKSITITDCAITHGKLKYDDDFDYYDVTNSTSRVQIHPTYPLWVGGRQVHAGNLDTIMGENDGSVRYNPTTKTLELSGGTISTKGSKCAIESEIAGLTIDVSSPQHKVFLQSEEGIAMWLKGKTTITGGGQLYATSRSSSAIYHKSDLTISDVSVTATGANRGICGDGNQELWVENAYISATGTAEGSICKNQLKSNAGYAITKPSGAVYYPSSTINGVYAGSPIKTLVKTEVVIEPLVTYPI